MILFFVIQRNLFIFNETLFVFHDFEILHLLFCLGLILFLKVNLLFSFRFRLFHFVIRFFYFLHFQEFIKLGLKFLLAFMKKLNRIGGGEFVTRKIVPMDSNFFYYYTIIYFILNFSCQMNLLEK